MNWATASSASWSIISTAAGTMPAATMPETAALQAATESNEGQQRAHAGRRVYQLDDGLGHDAEGALAAAEQPGQVHSRGRRPARWW